MTDADFLRHLAISRRELYGYNGPSDRLEVIAAKFDELSAYAVELAGLLGDARDALRSGGLIKTGALLRFIDAALAKNPSMGDASPGVAHQGERRVAEVVGSTPTPTEADPTQHDALTEIDAGERLYAEDATRHERHQMNSPSRAFALLRRIVVSWMASGTCEIHDSVALNEAMELVGLTPGKERHGANSSQEGKT